MPTPRKVLDLDDVVSPDGAHVLIITEYGTPALNGQRFRDPKTRSYVRLMPSMSPPLIHFITNAGDVIDKPTRLGLQWARVVDWQAGKYDPPLGSTRNPHPPFKGIA